MGDMSMPADYPTVSPSVYDEAKLVKLARQIAMGIKDLPDVLFDNSLTLREFDHIKELPIFKRTLESEVKSWEGADNTHNRLKLKTAALLEEYLPELYARLNDHKEPLMGKIKALELCSKIAGFSDREANAPTSPGDKVHVVINLGADVRAEYVKVLPHKVIDHEPAPPEAIKQTFDETFNEAFEESLNDRAD